MGRKAADILSKVGEINKLVTADMEGYRQLGHVLVRDYGWEPLIGDGEDIIAAMKRVEAMELEGILKIGIVALNMKACKRPLIIKYSGINLLPTDPDFHMDIYQKETENFEDAMKRLYTVSKERQTISTGDHC